MNRVECLDGLRGLAALWVVIGHCMILTGFYLPVLGNPDLGVDLFILLSGFLMVFQYNVRKEKEDWTAPATWVAFWFRRFFRLSPLYFTLLIVALVAGQTLFSERVAIDTFLGEPLQLASRYTDASPLNFLAHFTYIFGLIPAYAFRTPLPDWSLGLEMQFYAVFPFLVLLARKVGWLACAICCAMIAAAIAVAITKLGVSFPMPSFLPLKLHVFLAGMLIAAAMGERKPVYFVLMLMLVVIPIGGSHSTAQLVSRALIAISFFLLVHGRNTPVIGHVSRTLGSPPLHWLGELSYGVYLLHIMILNAAAAFVIDRWGHGISNGTRFAATFAIVIPIAYGIAYVTYTWIEGPGQTLGRKLQKAVINQRRAPQTVA